ncbi:MAG: serine/threonine-protein kinase [Myxococcales bacterium]
MASGGMASVHLGRLLGPVGFSKIVAIKRLHEQFATDPEFLSMFIDEARLASAISHPNVVSSLDVVVEHDELLLVMEYVQGETLAQLSKLARKQSAPASFGIIQRIVCDALDGLHAAHTASVGGRPLNIVHRDVSPQNIMVGVNGVARVLDFGIAKAQSQSQITRPGRVMGKTSYLSPEQLRGQLLDARTDVFSAGVVLWESLTQTRLFYAEDMQKTMERLLTAVIPTPSSKNPAVSSALDRVVMKALQRDVSQRYESAAAFADALRQVPGEATRAEVGAWVQSTASEVLAQRLEALEELEAMDIASVIAISEPPRSAPAASGDPLTPAERGSRPRQSRPSRPSARSHTEATVASFTSGGTTRSLSPKTRTPQRRHVVWGLGIALLAGTVAVIVSLTSGHPASAPAVSNQAPALVTAPPSAQDSEPVLAPTLPVAELATASAAPEPPPAPPLSSATPSKHRAASKPARPAAAAPNCNPPYRIDASGVRRVRFECL